MIIAVDFDNTLAKTDFPTIIEPIQEVIDYIKEQKFQGASIILWTARNGSYLDEALAWCKEQGLTFDAVNDDISAIKEAWGDNRSKKVTADMYIDDLAVNTIDLIQDYQKEKTIKECGL